MVVGLSPEEEYDGLIALIRRMAKFDAFWPFDIRDVGGDVVKLKNARTLQCYFMGFIIFYMLLTAVVLIADVAQHWGDMEKVTECGLPAASFVLIIFRLFVYASQRDNITSVIEKMRNDWISSSDEDREIYREKCGPAFKLTKLFIMCTSNTIVGFNVIPVIEMYFLGSDEWLLPFGGYFGFDVDKFPTYHIIYALEIISAVIAVCNVCAVTSFNFVSTIHASANFLILQKHIVDLKSNEKNSPELLRSCIKEHIRAIEFADTLEEIINKVALGQFIVSTGLVCFAGLQISSLLDNKARLLQYSVYINAAVLELFLFSYSGYALASESESVGSAAFNSDWVGSPFTKNLQIMMMRATKPNTITAAKFYDMSLESFTMVLSTSFSYFTTLRAVNEE